MTDLPAGWDVYDPDNHERSREPEYRRARESAAARGGRRRGEYGAVLAALRRARSMTQVLLAAQLGVAQGEVSRIEYQADLLLSTLARYIDGLGGELSLLVRFADHAIELELDALDELVVGEPSVEVAIAPDPAIVAELGGYLGRFESQEARFRAVDAA